jgi:hypothetical protein
MQIVPDNDLAMVLNQAVGDTLLSKKKKIQIVFKVNNIINAV